MAVLEAGISSPVSAPPGEIPSASGSRTSHEAPALVESQMRQQLTGVFGDAMYSPGLVADTADVLEQAAQDLADFEAGHISEDEYRANIESLAAGVGEDLAPSLATAATTLETNSLVANKRAEDAKVLAAREKKDPDPRLLRDDENAQFSVRAASRLLEEGVRVKSLGLFNQIKTIQADSAESSTPEPSSPAKVSSVPRGSLMLRAGMLSSRAFEAVGNARGVTSLKGEHNRRKRLICAAVGVTAVAAMTAVAYLDKSGMSHAHLAAAAQNIPHGRSGTSAGDPQLTGVTRVPHLPGSRPDVVASSAHVGNSGVEQVAAPKNVQFATGTNAEHILHYEQGPHNTTVIKLEGIDPKQSLINGYPIDLTHAKGLHAIITVTDKNGEQQFYSVPVHNGRAVLTGELHRLVNSQDHHAMVQIEQNGSHGTERIFSSAVSDGHRVSGHEAQSLSRAAHAPGRGGARYHRRGGPGYAGRGTAAVPSRGSDKLTEIEPGIAIIGGALAWAVGGSILVDKNEKRKERANATRRGLPPPTYNSRHSRGRDRNTDSGHEMPDAPDPAIVHEGQVRAAQHEMLQLQKEHLERMARETFQHRDEVKEEDKDRLGEDFADEGEARAAIVRRSLELSGEDMSDVISAVRIGGARIAQPGRNGQPPVLVPPSEGGTVTSYISIIEELARNEVAGRVKRSEADAYGLMVAARMADGRTVEELYDYLTSAP